MKKTLLILLSFVVLISAPAQMSGASESQAAAPRAIIIVAHPDDESCFSATVYQITHNLHGKVDQLIVTNGEGGFRYSLLAEPYYGVPLTTEAVGRASLPEIRKREALNSGQILGISNHYFLDERDVRYTQDVQEVLEKHWDVDSVRKQVLRRLQEGKYDYVLTLFPTADTHGAHKAATLMAYEAIGHLTGAKPVLLSCQLSAATDAAPPQWAPSLGSTNAKVLPDHYKVGRLTKFGFNKVLDYQIIANWVVAEHKSQGAFQKDMDKYDTEEFAVLDTGTQDAAPKAASLFTALSQTAIPAAPATK